MCPTVDTLAQAAAARSARLRATIASGAPGSAQRDVASPATIRSVVPQPGRLPEEPGAPRGLMSARGLLAVVLLGTGGCTPNFGETVPVAVAVAVSLFCSCAVALNWRPDGEGQ